MFNLLHSYHFDSGDASRVSRCGLAMFAWGVVALLIDIGRRLTLGIEAVNDPMSTAYLVFLVPGVAFAMLQMALWFGGLTRALKSSGSVRKRAEETREVYFFPLLLVWIAIVWAQINFGPVPDAVIVENVNRLHTTQARESYAAAVKRDIPFDARRSDAALRAAMAIDAKQKPAPVDSVQQMQRAFGDKR